MDSLTTSSWLRLFLERTSNSVVLLYSSSDLFFTLMLICDWMLAFLQSTKKTSISQRITFVTGLKVGFGFDCIQMNIIRINSNKNYICSKKGKFYEFVFGRKRSENVLDVLVPESSLKCDKLMPVEFCVLFELAVFILFLTQFGKLIDKPFQRFEVQSKVCIELEQGLLCRFWSLNFL